MPQNKSVLQKLDLIKLRRAHKDAMCQNVQLDPTKTAEKPFYEVK